MVAEIGAPVLFRKKAGEEKEKSKSQTIPLPLSLTNTQIIELANKREKNLPFHIAHIR